MELDSKNRESIIIKTSLLGIATNLFLSLFKGSIGILTNSLGIRLDALNNLSDALSSLISIVGTKLAAKSPDQKHPFGHGRIEYLSTSVVAILILYAGISSLVESVKKILSPVQANYDSLSLWFLGFAIFVKIGLGQFVQAQGRKAKSDVLIASGKDAFFDAILSASVLVSALIYQKTGLSLEAYISIFLSLMIIRAGLNLLKEPLHDIVGAAPNPELSKKIKKILEEEEEVRGAYDLMIHNYGPRKQYASVSLEIRDTLSLAAFDELSRKLEAKVYKDTGVILLSIGVYSYHVGGGEAEKLRNEILEKVLEYPWALQLHAFYFQEKEKKISFDVVMSFDIMHEEGLKILYDRMKEDYPTYSFQIRSDIPI